MTITLRPYQREARNAVIEAWDSGQLNVLTAMATGTGKTETFLSILAAEHKAGRLKRALIIAHREELIFQPVDRIATSWLGQLPAAGVVMGKHNQPHAPIVVATIQTLYGRRNPKRDKKKPNPIRRFRRLREMIQTGSFSHVIVDECHHATADSYTTVLRALRLLSPGLRHLGVTATPKRSDQEGLVKVYDTVAYRLGIKEAITEIGCLTPFKGLSFSLPVSFSGVKVRAGDYAAGDVGEVMSATNAREIVVQKWLEFGEGRQTMAFTASVKQARLLAEEFQVNGVAAAWAHGGTAKDERQAIIADYRAKKYQVLINCALWTEGFDVPETSCIAMARPTRSDLVYVQAVGRGLRTSPGKTDCLVLDFVPLDSRDLVMAGDLLGMPRQIKKKLKDAEKDEVLVLEGAFFMDEHGNGIDADPDEVLVAQLDFFGASRLRWSYDGLLSTCAVDKGESVAVVMPQRERMAKALELRAGGDWREEWNEALERVSNHTVYAIKNKRITVLGTAEEWQEAVDIAEDYADGVGGADVIVKKGRAWMARSPSEKTVGFARRLGIEINGQNAGQLSQEINHKLALSELRRAGFIK